MGIMSLGAYVRREFGATVRLVHQRLDDLTDEEVAREAVDFGADIVALSSLSPDHGNQKAISLLIRQKLPKALILLGGPHVYCFGSTALEGSGADAAVPGEGELALRDMIEAFNAGASFSGIPGIYWRDKDGTIVKNPGCTEEVQELDSLPMPAYDLIDLPKYWKRQSASPLPRRRYAPLFSSRGCPYGCIYCHNIFGRRCRTHSAERIIEDIDYLQRKFGVSEFDFLDDIFNLDKRRLAEFCDRVQRRAKKLHISFPNGVRADLLTAEEIDALAGAGMYYCTFALESGSARIQKVICKHLDIGKFLDAVAHAARRRVFTNGFVMLGFPTETREDMEMTINVACSSSLHTASFFTVMPFPNTLLYERVLKHHPEKVADQSYLEGNYYDNRFNLSDEPDEVLSYYQRKAFRKFYMHPRLLRIATDFPHPLGLIWRIPIMIRHFLGDKRMTPTAVVKTDL
jgi:radical SAM superfamily enzyme YgiQ (UPF0313 family)